jgi:hypothetical protein
MPPHIVALPEVVAEHPQFVCQSQLAHPVTEYIGAHVTLKASPLGVAVPEGQEVGLHSSQHRPLQRSLGVTVVVVVFGGVGSLGQIQLQSFNDASKKQ